MSHHLRNDENGMEIPKHRISGENSCFIRSGFSKNIGFYRKYRIIFMCEIYHIKILLIQKLDLLDKYGLWCGNYHSGSDGATADQCCGISEHQHVPYVVFLPGVQCWK